MTDEELHDYVAGEVEKRANVPRVLGLHPAVAAVLFVVGALAYVLVARRSRRSNG